jgi:F-type H+-transporting ATPase subunit a
VKMDPMHQFAVEPLSAHPLLQIAGHPIYFTNQALWMFIVVGAISLFMVIATSRRALVPGRMQSLAEISYEFVANMIGTSTGEDGMKFFPFVFTLFMFVLFSNFLGLLPGSFTVTSQIAVTFALAAFVVLLVIVTGFLKHGVGFLMLFVAKAPWYLIPPLALIEVISFLTRPISLSVRLFANMLGGHTMLKVFASFVIMLGGAGGVLSILSVAPFALIVAITALELLIAFLQAYVFAVLTCIYLGEALHLHDNH